MVYILVDIYVYITRHKFSRTCHGALAVLFFFWIKVYVMAIIKNTVETVG